LGGLAPVRQHPDVTWPQAFLSAFALVGQYLAKLFWPNPLLAFYVFRKSTSVADPQVLLGITALLLITILFALLWSRARIYSFALVWMALTLAPVLNARWMATNVFAERYLYLPSVGFCALLAGGIAWTFRNAARDLPLLRWATASAAVFFCAVCTIQIVARNRDWQDDLTLLNRTLAIQPHASYMRTDLGTLEWDRQHHEEAERQWLLALDDKPDNAFALSNLGLASLEKKQYRAAESYLLRSISLRPNFAPPHIHLGNLFLAENRRSEAEQEFRKAVGIYPLSTPARNALGKLLFEDGRMTESEQQYSASRESLPNPEAWDGLGDIDARQGLRAKSEEAWKQALLLSPFDGHAHQCLGAAYFAEGRRVEAEKEFRAVLLLDPANVEARSALLKLGATNLPPAPPSFHP
jgi:tetratricopeptide (TPR) repeat protein